MLEVVIGFSGGLAVGAGYVAVLTMLGIIPRLVQLSKSAHLMNVYIGAVISGVLVGTYLSFTNQTWRFPVFTLSVFGMFHGIFIGMMAAALTEVLNVFPLIAKRIGLAKYILPLMMALAFGKVIGSLFQWIIFVK